VGEFKKVEYFLVSDERKEIIEVLGPGETTPPTWAKGAKYKKMNTWGGIDEVADVLAEYKYIPYRKYLADKKGKMLRNSLKQGVRR